jgi:hypothetical protein
MRLPWGKHKLKMRREEKARGQNKSLQPNTRLRSRRSIKNHAWRIWGHTSWVFMSEFDPWHPESNSPSCLLPLHRILSKLLLLPRFCGDGRCTSNPAWFSISPDSKDPIVIERGLHPRWNALPLIGYADHPIRRYVPNSVKMNVKMSSLGLGDSRWH